MWNLLLVLSDVQNQHAELWLGEASWQSAAIVWSLSWPRRDRSRVEIAVSPAAGWAVFLIRCRTAVNTVVNNVNVFFADG